MCLLYVLEISCTFHTCFHHGILTFQHIHLQIILQIVDNEDQIISQLDYTDVAVNYKYFAMKES